MLAKTTTVLRTVSKTRAFSTGAFCAGGMKLQKAFIDYLEDAQRRQAVKTSATATNDTSPPPSEPALNAEERKMYKIPIDYIHAAEAKVAAARTTTGLPNMPKTRSFSTSAFYAGDMKLQKGPLDFLEEAQRRQATKTSSAETRKMYKIPIDYIHAAEAKVAAARTTNTGLHNMPKTRTFSTRAFYAGDMKLQKGPLDYLEEAQRRQATKTSTATKAPPSAERRKMYKLPIDYIQEAEAKVAAAKRAPSSAAGSMEPAFDAEERLMAKIPIDYIHEAEAKCAA